MIPYNQEEQFFKYYGVRAAKAVLSDVRLKWSKPLLFNDPFDSQIDVSINEDVELMAQQTFDKFMSTVMSDVALNPTGTFSTQMEYLRRIVQKVGIPKKDIPSLMEAARLGATSAASKIPEINAQIKANLHDVCMFCVTESNDNKLMWSHYSDQHKGIVIKFLPKVDDSPLSVAQKVNYVDSIPKFEAKDFLEPESMPSKAINHITLTKGREWEYEKEWRVVTFMRDPTQPFELIPFSRQELGAVYLGAKMEDMVRDEIIGLCLKNFPHADIYQASLNSNDFKISFAKL